MLVARYGVHNRRRSHFRFRSANDARLDRPRLIEPASAEQSLQLHTDRIVINYFSVRFILSAGV